MLGINLNMFCNSSPSFPPDGELSLVINTSDDRLLAGTTLDTFGARSPTTASNCSTNSSVNFRVTNPRFSASSMSQQPANMLALSVPQYPLPEMGGSLPTPARPSPAVSPLTPAPRRRRVAPRQPRPSRDEEVIGQVLMNKRKFKCVNVDCIELTFGRLADLRRHHDQQHARNRQVYYCRATGCPRSYAETGGRGRSFGTRKDKRDEHERKVHDMDRSDNSDRSTSLAESA